MDFFVNSEKIDVSLENEKTVGDVLVAFEKEFAANNATTVAIVLDGENISANDFERIAKKSLSECSKLELSVMNVSDIERELKLSADDFSKLADELENIPVLMQSGKDVEAGVLIKRVADEIENFCRVASLSPEKYDKMILDGKQFSEFFAEFSPILKDFESALESKDTVLTGDLAEYELTPRIRAIANAIRM